MKQFFSFFISLHLILSPVMAAEEVTEVESAEAVAPKVNKTVQYVKMLLGLSQGIIGTGITTQCTLGTSQPSLLLYMAGSLTYIGNEIFTAKSQGQTFDQQVVDMSDPEKAKDDQLNMLRQQKKNEEENVKTLKKKRNWMIAITTIYGLATAAAIIEFFLNKPTPVGIAKPSSGACNTATGINKPVVKAIELAYLSSGIFQTAKSGVEAIKSKNAIGIGMFAVSAKLTGVGQIKQFIAILKGTTETTSKAVGKLYNMPIARAISFGASGVLTGVIASDLAKQKNQAEKNVATVEKVISSMVVAEAPKVEIEPGNATAAAGKDKKYAIKELAKAKDVKSCWTKTNEGLDYSESGCSNSLKLTQPTFDISIKMPTLSDGTKYAHDFSQAVADGDMAKADIAAGNLASMAGRVKELNDQLENKYNDSQKAAGAPTTDFKKEIAARVAALQNDVQNAAAAAGAQVASEKIEEAPVSDLTPEVVLSAPTPAGPAVEELKLDLTEDVPAEEGAGPVASSTNSLDQFEISEQDISKNDVSIFKQVSHRYILNYTKMLNSKKPSIEGAGN